MRGVGWPEGECAMWAFVVVMGGVDTQHPFGVAAAEDQHPIETFGADPHVDERELRASGHAR